MIRREDANHILRNLIVNLKHIIKTECKVCHTLAYEQIEELFAKAERELKQLGKE